MAFQKKDRFKKGPFQKKDRFKKGPFQKGTVSKKKKACPTNFTCARLNCSRGAIATVLWGREKNRRRESTEDDYSSMCVPDPSCFIKDIYVPAAS